MVNIDKLRGKIVEKRFTIETLAEALKIDRSTLYRKLNERGETFTMREAEAIAKLLGLSPEEAVAIFFAPTVA